MSKTKSTASSAIDANNDASPPLDFSFKCLTGLLDCKDEEPRSKVKPSKSGKYKTRSIKFQNNGIADYEGFSTVIEDMLENPDQLEWIDLSFNAISTIDQVLLSYPQLKSINLHANCIEKLGEIDKLAGLQNLKSITLHGNPIENIKGYKDYVIATLPQIQKLDFTRITKADRANSLDWKEKYGAKFKKKCSHAVKS